MWVVLTKREGIIVKHTTIIMPPVGSSSTTEAVSSSVATAPSSTTTAAPRTEEIAAGARLLTQELKEFLDQHPSLQTASTAQAAAKSDIPELQLSTCRKLREVGCLCRMELLKFWDEFKPHGGIVSHALVYHHPVV